MAMSHILLSRIPELKPKIRRPPPLLERLDRLDSNTEYVLPHSAPAPYVAPPPPAPAPAPAPAPPASCVTPALERWPGRHGFEVTLGSLAAQGGRQAPYVYDPVARKLYVDMLIAVPVLFRVARGTDTTRLRVSALPVYPETHHLNTPVRRCPTHRQPGLDININAGMEAHINHVIRAEHANARYVEAGPGNERRSVVVPYEQPQPGTDEFKVLYKFACMNTCVGGINRRRLVVVFTLEDDRTGEPLGRQTIEVKVCKCPHRDYRTEKTRREPEQQQRPAKATKRRRASPEWDASPPAVRRRAGPQLVVPVDDEDMYDHLIAVRDSLRLIRARREAREVREAAARLMAQPGPGAPEPEPEQEQGQEPEPSATDLQRRATINAIKMEML